MSEKLSVKFITYVMNAIIAFTLISGIFMLGDDTYQLIYNSAEIDITRIEIPWYQPQSNVTIMLHKNVLEKDRALLNKINKNIFTHDLIGNYIFIVLLIFILWYLKKLLISIRGQTFFEKKNINIIRLLSYFVIFWVICNFILYQSIPLFIPSELIFESINFVPVYEHFFHSLISSIDFKMLFVALVLYAIAISFKEGYSLKEQSDLTI